MIIAPPKGTPVMVYESALTTNEPNVGIVLDSTPSGVLRIGVIPKQGGTIEVRPTVYHISHPSLRDILDAPSVSALRNGGWDYHPWFTPALEKIAPKEKSVATKEEKVVALSKEFDFETVCFKVRSLGLKADDVREIYKVNGIEVK
jgi:hypothetical protein